VSVAEEYNGLMYEYARQD